MTNHWSVPSGLDRAAIARSEADVDASWAAAVVLEVSSPGGFATSSESIFYALLSLRDGVAYDPFDHEPTLADGLAGGFGAVPFAVAADLIHDVLLSDEKTMRRAMFTLLDRHQLVVEASGAIAIAPLLTNQIDITGLTVVCVLSGGNVDTAVLRDILNEFS